MMNPLFKQSYLSWGLWCQQFHTAFVYGLQTGIVKNLRQPDNPIQLSSDQESWIVSIMFLMMCPSNALAGILTPRFGRKYVYLVLVIPNVISVILLYVAKDYYTLITGFVMTGLSGGTGPIGSITIAECCSPKARGTLLDLKYSMLFLGIATARLLSNFFDWRILILFNGVPLIFTIITCSSCPESPAWLASKGRFEECKASYIWFRGDKEPDELNSLIDWQDQVLKKQSRNRRKPVLFNTIKTIQDKSFWKAVSISFICIIFIDICGKVSLVSYLDIINTVTKDPTNAINYILTIDISDFLGLCVSTITVTKIRRRTLLFGLGIPTIIWLYIFCGVCYLSSLNLLSSSMSWLPFTMLVVYFFMISTSSLSILNTIMGEIYPLEYRGIGITINSVVFGVSTFLVAKTTSATLKCLDVHGMFLLYAICCSLALLYLYYTLPETFKKTLQNIECELKDIEINRNLSLEMEIQEKMLGT